MITSEADRTAKHGEDHPTTRAPLNLVLWSALAQGGALCLLA